MSRLFTTTSGVRREHRSDVLSPLIFIESIDSVCKDAIQENERDLDEMLFADDQAVVAVTSENLQQHLTFLEQECKACNMTISIEKTEVKKT